MTAHALKIKSAPEVPPPPIALGEHGQKHWREHHLAFTNWLPGELILLANASAAWQEIQTITAELADPDLAFKQRRQLRADRRASMTVYRQQMRELSLGSRAPDTRAPRVAGRYNGSA